MPCNVGSKFTPEEIPQQNIRRSKISTLMFHYDEGKTAMHVYSSESKDVKAVSLHQASALHPEICHVIESYSNYQWAKLLALDDQLGTRGSWWDWLYHSYVMNLPIVTFIEGLHSPS